MNDTIHVHSICSPLGCVSVKYLHGATLVSAQDVTVDHLKKSLHDIIKLDAAPPKVVDVVLNNQAAIVFWEDDVKTVVKCRECGDGVCLLDRSYAVDEGDHGAAVADMARKRFCLTQFDEEKAIMAAMLTRLYPNYQDVLREALEEEKED